MLKLSVRLLIWGDNCFKRRQYIRIIKKEVRILGFSGAFKRIPVVIKENGNKEGWFLKLFRLELKIWREKIKTCRHFCGRNVPLWFYGFRYGLILRGRNTKFNLFYAGCCGRHVRRLYGFDWQNKKPLDNI